MSGLFNKAKLIITIISGLILSTRTAAQTADDYFVLGTFSNYIGREYIDTLTCEVDYYYPYEKVLARYIQTSVARRYGWNNTLLKKKEQRIHLYSCPQFAIIDSLYRHSKGLTKDIFITNDQSLSYLHGVYLRYGQCINDTICYIKVHNSNHGRLFYSIALLQGFSGLSIKELNTIPHTTYVYFSPTPEFLDIIRYTSKVKSKLIKAEEKVWKKILSPEVYFEYKLQKNKMQPNE